MMLLDAGHLHIGVDAVQMFYCRVRRKEERESTSTTLSSCTESPELCLVQHSPTDCMLQPWLPEPAWVYCLEQSCAATQVEVSKQMSSVCIRFSWPCCC